MRTKWIWVHFPAVTDHRATPTEEAQPPPEHLLPKGQVLVVLLIGGGTVTRLQPALERIADHVVLSQMPLTVVHSPSTTAEVDQALVASPHAQHISRVLAADDSKDGFAVAIRKILGQVHTKFLISTTLPRVREIPRIASEAGRRIRALHDVTPALHAPILLPTSRTPRQVVAAYVDERLNAAQPPTGASLDYLAALNFDAASPSLEAIDPRGGAVEARIWFNARPDPGAAQPPWRIRVVLLAGSKVVQRSERVPLTQRVDRFGVLRWDDLIAHLPLPEAAEGHYRMALELDSVHPELQRRRDLPPRHGAIVAARTVPIRDGETGELLGRYLLHTVGTRKAAYLSVQRGAGAVAERRWEWSLLRKDLRFILRGPNSRRMRWWRLVRLLTRPFVNHRVWLIGERADTAQDNGMHLFRHLRTELPEQRSYYVIDRSSPHYERVRALGHVVQHSSLRHRMLLLHAEVLANANSIHYMIPRQWDPGEYARHLAWRVGALRVYLKHGVHLSPNAVKRGSQGFDMVLTVTPRETEALRLVTGYSDQLTETGLPRYDALVPTPSSRTILFMTTWRRYLVPKLFGGENVDQIPFSGSDYERFTTGLLGSQRLHRLLEHYDFTLMFVPHYNMADYFTDTATAGNRITVADTDASDLQDLLRKCDVFITDYSSVHFDVAYLGTPIIYARFDEEEFESRHASPSWFDYENDGFGPVTRTLEQTLDELQSLLERGCVLDQRYRDRIETEFTYRDQSNSCRTIEAIRRRLDLLHPSPGSGPPEG